MDKLLAELDEAENKAWDSLSRYKFNMFGYWAAIWVHLNKISGEHRPNPFVEMVQNARTRSDSWKRSIQRKQRIQSYTALAEKEE